MSSHHDIDDLDELENFLAGSKLSKNIQSILREEQGNISLKLMSALKKHEDRKAGEYRAVIEHIENFRDLIKTRVKMIRESQKEE